MSSKESLLPEKRLLAERTETQKLLQQIVCGMTMDLSLREDMLQEGLLHLWLREKRFPGRDEGWYLQSCRFHINNFLRNGRSLDSWKRRQAQFFPQASDQFLTMSSDEGLSNESLVSLVSAREILSLLSEWLTVAEKQVLNCLADGLSAREIGKQLDRKSTRLNS